jgi:predicted TPR repeat methyltransferase
MSGRRLDTVYSLDSPEAAAEFYGRWADEYENELTASGYVTPLRCAAALAAHASLPWAPLIELGCGTGMGGLALREAGFECIDGVDISPEMLAKAEAKGIYRALAVVDLSQPLDAIADDTYQNAAAIGVLNPSFIPPTVIDEVLRKLPEGGCFVFSLNDHALAGGLMETRVLELTEYGVADLVFKEQGEHIPEIELASTVFVLRKR